MVRSFVPLHTYMACATDIATTTVVRVPVVTTRYTHSRSHMHSHTHIYTRTQGPFRSISARLGSDKFPFGIDGIDLLGVITEHARQYVYLYYANDAALAADVELKHFYEQLRLNGNLQGLLVGPLVGVTGCSNTRSHIYLCAWWCVRQTNNTDLAWLFPTCRSQVCDEYRVLGVCAHVVGRHACLAYGGPGRRGRTPVRVHFRRVRIAPRCRQCGE